MTEESRTLPGATDLYEANGVELTLPASFQLGDVERNLEALFDSLPPEAQPYEQMMRDFYSDNQDDIVLWAYDAENANQEYTNLLIIRNEAFAALPLSMITIITDTFVDEALEGLLQETVTLGGRETLRLLTTAQVNDDANAQVIYFFKEADVLWMMGFFTNKADIDSQLMVFDAAVASFTVLSQE